MDSKSPARSDLAEIDYSRLGPKPGSRLLVVGGRGGIGRAIVDAALKTDLKVAIFDLAASLEQHKPPAGTVMSAALDASDEASVTKAFAELDKTWNGVDCMVNLAGAPLVDERIDTGAVGAFDSAVAISLRSTYLVSRATLPRMHASGGGSIVNTASSLAHRGAPGASAYAAAKAGVIAFTKTLALENAPAIRANTIAPGRTRTAFLLGGTGRISVEEQSKLDGKDNSNVIPLRRIAYPEDMVGPVLFLLGPASRYITGHTININGGGFMQ